MKAEGRRGEGGEGGEKNLVTMLRIVTHLMAALRPRDRLRGPGTMYAWSAAAQCLPTRSVATRCFCPFILPPLSLILNLSSFNLHPHPSAFRLPFMSAPALRLFFCEANRAATCTPRT